ncbi:hypothetical protein AB0O42_05465 [Streptomyces sp. NPDC089922]|uniref:hypothetical protein n=1 Tax=Streptomyces sp. NPDC089922 TaxID=3155189 RepID=UPI003426DFD6
MTNALTALGAPELPADYFYRVADEYYGITVQVRRERRFGSAFVTEVYATPQPGQSAERALALACMKLRRFVLEAAEERRKVNAMAQYVGDHK